MEDLLEELLNVLAEQPSSQAAHKEIPMTKQLANSNEAATHKSQANGRLVDLESNGKADKIKDYSVTAEDPSLFITLFDAGIAVPELPGHRAFSFANERRAELPEAHTNKNEVDASIFEVTEETAVERGSENEHRDAAKAVNDDAEALNDVIETDAIEADAIETDAIETDCY